MKQQIKRLSLHQNGKVIAVLMAISAVILFIPMAIMMYFIAPQVDQDGNPVELPILLFAIMPLIYLVFGYIVVVIGCAIYNFLYSLIGGLEFELEDMGD